MSERDIPVAEIVKPKARSTWDQLVHSKIMVLGLLFVVTGALGLPALWVSPVFNLIEKILYLIVVLAYTASLLWGTYLILRWAYLSIVY